MFGVLWLRKPAQDLQPVQFSVEAPKGFAFPNNMSPGVVSPDGKTLVFGAGTTGGPRPLWIRPIGSLSTRLLPKTEGALEPFWSPDSQSIAFFADAKLKRTSIATGITTVICDTGAYFSGAWATGDIILFSSDKGIYRIASSGGTPALVTPAGEPAFFPQLLPNGKNFLYFRPSNDEAIEGVYAGSLDGTPANGRILATSKKALYARPSVGRPGYLLWVQDRTLMAQRFDASKLTLDGEASPIVEEVAWQASAPMSYAAWMSDSGAVTMRRPISRGPVQMVWIGRDGKRELVGPEGLFDGMRLSPDRKRAALVRYDGANSDIWIYDFARAAMTRFTFDPAQEAAPVWSPDGREIAYTLTKDKTVRVMKKGIDGGAEQVVLDSGGGPLDDWTPDGRHLLFSLRSRSTNTDIFTAAAQAESKRSDWYIGPGSQSESSVSPDGKWIAYADAASSARSDIFVRTWSAGQPASGNHWQVAAAGNHPRWSGDGKTLFYQTVGGKIMTVSITAGAGGIDAGGAPREFVTTTASFLWGSWNYDTSADGQRILALEPVGGEAPGVGPLDVLLNWQSMLK